MANKSAIQKKYDELYNKQVKGLTELANKSIADQNSLIDKTVQLSSESIQRDIDQIPTAYQAQYDTTAVQNALNKKQVTERLANMGLSNSGMNETSQTAFAVSQLNANQMLTQKKNAAIANLKQSIADLTAQAGLKKTDYANTVNQNLASSKFDLRTKYDAAIEDEYASQVAAERQAAAARASSAAKATSTLADSLEKELRKIYKDKDNYYDDAAKWEAMEEARDYYIYKGLDGTTAFNLLYYYDDLNPNEATSTIEKIPAYQFQQKANSTPIKYGTLSTITKLKKNK